MLLNYFKKDVREAGLDEAGRGCLAGPVVAAAVILPNNFYHPLLNDSKQLSEKDRDLLKPIIEKEAVAYAVAFCFPEEIDRINILQASVQAMHKAVAALAVAPQHLIVDGNYFKSIPHMPHQCIVGGDGKYASIAAASVLAKTARDAYMKDLHGQHPQYGWAQNKGYGTAAHRLALQQHGPSPFHRRSFRLQYH